MSSLVSNDRRHNRYEFVPFLNQPTPLRRRSEISAQADAHSRPRFSAFLQANRTLRDEVFVALCGACFLEHRRKRQRAGKKLRNHQLADPLTLVEHCAEPDNIARVLERPVTDVLTVFVRRRSFRRVVVDHGRTTKQARCHSTIVDFVGVS
jgi:REP element-mobilizing transposase RayT